jgi:isoamylase
MTFACEPGRPWPLGASLRDGGVNFAVFSGVADQVEICLFDADGQRELQRIALPGRSDAAWHGFVPGLAAGALYGLRVHGPYQPDAGQRCNPAKLLLDPYARALDRPLRGAAWQYGYTLGSEEQDLLPDPQDNGAEAAKCVVVDDRFDWGDDAPPAIPMDRSVLYEMHVKGFTRQLADVPQALRGTYAGLANDAAIAHLKLLGVTAVELLPVHAFNDERRLIELGLGNYWGYNSVGFFAPDPRYSSQAGQAGLAEFKGMVKALHAAGLEVILDVVYNHTAEGNHLGPTVCFKGIDNAAYYRLAPDPRYCVDFTGTGNTVDASNPDTLRLVMDSLRYWVQEMHVDGFRFDLAPAISRNGAGEFDHRAPFLAAVAQDPVLCRVKLIAEPWDIGENGYQVGGFPAGWSEWNGRYRDAVRDFWRSSEGAIREFAARLCGSADIYAGSRRNPVASVNCITVHDGFTLHDLVSYNDKHNEANQEDNRDGESHNRSWNCGEEGETDDAQVLALRQRQQRNFLATLLVSRGVPAAAGRRRNEPHPGRQQQCLLPGQRGELVRLAAGRPTPAAGRLRPGADRPAHRTAGAAAKRLAVRRRQRAGRARHRLVQRLGPGDDAGGMGRPGGALRRRFARWPLRRRARSDGAAGLQRLGRSRQLHLAAASRWHAGLADAHRHGPRPLQRRRCRIDRRWRPAGAAKPRDGGAGPAHRRMKMRPHVRFGV